MSLDPEPSTIPCPACGHEFVPGEAALQQCPACGEQFFRESEDGLLDLDDEQARLAMEERLEADREKLDDRRIKDVKLQKQTLYRARSWMLVAALCCVGFAGQLVWIGVRDAAHRPQGKTITYYALAAALVAVSVRFFCSARAYLREADAIHLPEPTTKPDFSNLGDGSHFARNLEDMTDR